MDRALIVDDDQNILTTLEFYLEEQGFQVTTAASGKEALAKLAAARPQVVLLDLKLPDMDGLEVLRRIKATGHPARVVMVTAHATIETAVQAVKEGAFDYLAKPFTPAQLEHLLRLMGRMDSLEAQVASLEEQLQGIAREGDFVTRSRQVRALLKVARQAADSAAGILLTGESGTGKGVLAQLIHDWSPRRAGPFIRVDCTVLQENLLESDLFGHLKGSFTGALADKTGKLAQAEGGTVFLDEVTEMSAAMQAKLLHFLQSREFTPVGGTQARRVDARIVAATNRNLERAVEEGVFREDLYYRLNVVELALPPLRERPEDIPLLAGLYLKRLNREHGKALGELSPAALELLTAYPWPGNVRELINALQRAVIVAPGPRLEPGDLPPQVAGFRPGEAAAAGLKSLETLEREHIAYVLARTRTMEEAAQVLGIDPATLWRKRKKYGLA
ncbi:MAG: sigma-54 dependent transcriptional regulator [Deltaproteobacteria bacterium]|nr:sigma-54 dependent transcriptional regulator [Deltaproteobacteria bacterium]